MHRSVSERSKNDGDAKQSENDFAGQSFFDVFCHFVF
jgi:hypothetical protein